MSVARGNNGTQQAAYGSNNMEAYDQLPKAMRHALMYADHNWSARHVLQCRRKKRVVQAHGNTYDFRTTKSAIEAIRLQDKRQHELAVQRGAVCGGQR